MERFQLPFFSAGMSLNDAFAELCETNVSGLVIPSSTRNYRLISFDQMTEALARGAMRLDLVKGNTLPFLEDVSNEVANDLVIKLGGTIGLLKVHGRRADLFSISEGLASPYLSSSVLRCDRPNKPQGESNQKWYHYYPPNRSPSPRPHKCVGAGCPGMVR